MSLTSSNQNACPKFQVNISNDAQKDVEVICGKNIGRQIKVLEAIREKLSKNPLPNPPHTKKLVSLPENIYELVLKAGMIRVLYRLSGRVVNVFHVIHRKDLERFLKQIR